LTAPPLATRPASTCPAWTGSTRPAHREARVDGARLDAHREAPALTTRRVSDVARPGRTTRPQRSARGACPTVPCLDAHRAPQRSPRAPALTTSPASALDASHEPQGSPRGPRRRVRPGGSPRAPALTTRRASTCPTRAAWRLPTSPSVHREARVRRVRPECWRD
jgi:hypothetical protein